MPAVMLGVFSFTLFCSASLLFLVEPMVGKMMLPLLGGTPAVWNTCMVFFETGLLLGYAYAHYVPDRLGPRRHAVLHGLALAAAAWTLPIALPATVPAGWHPVLWLLVALAMGVGLPFFLVSASTPLLQRWYALGDTTGTRDPYFLYAASNLGSFAGLVSYPLLAEPALTLPAQAWFWFGGYLVLLVLTASCFPWRASRHPSLPAIAPQQPAASWPRRLRWVMLALIPCSLMLSVTTYLTTDIAPVPLLWVIPMGLYLLTFVLAFSGRPRLPAALVQRWVPLAVLVAVVVRLLEASDPLPVVLAVHLLVLFWLALACHGELARDRPSADRLTEFYLCLALGGARRHVQRLARAAPLHAPDRVSADARAGGATVRPAPNEPPQPRRPGVGRRAQRRHRDADPDRSDGQAGAGRAGPAQRRGHLRGAAAVRLRRS